MHLCLCQQTQQQQATQKLRQRHSSSNSISSSSAISIGSCMRLENFVIRLHCLLAEQSIIISGERMSIHPVFDFVVSCLLLFGPVFLLFGPVFPLFGFVKVQIEARRKI